MLLNIKGIAFISTPQKGSPIVKLNKLTMEKLFKFSPIVRLPLGSDVGHAVKTVVAEIEGTERKFPPDPTSSAHHLHLRDGTDPCEGNGLVGGSSRVCRSRCGGESAVGGKEPSLGLQAERRDVGLSESVHSSDPSFTVVASFIQRVLDGVGTPKSVPIQGLITPSKSDSKSNWFCLLRVIRNITFVVATTRNHASGFADTHVMSQVNSGAGFNGLLRNGYKSFSGTQDAVIRNIDACRELCAIHRTSLGPNGRLCVSCITLGMSKLVVNQLDKIFITSDTATIVKEMEVVHPAAKLLVEAAQKQEQEVGCLAWVRA